MCISVCISSMSSQVFFSTQSVGKLTFIRVIADRMERAKIEERGERVVIEVISAYHHQGPPFTRSLGCYWLHCCTHCSEQANKEREKRSSALCCVSEQSHFIFSEVLKSLRQLSFEWTVLNRELMSHYRSEWVWVSSRFTRRASSLFFSHSRHSLPPRDT